MNRAIALGAALVVASLAGSRWLNAQPSRSATGRAATVDVVRVFNEYEKQKDLAEEFKAEQDKLDAENQQRRAKIDALQATVDRMQPSDPLYADRARELFQMQVEYKNWYELKRAAIGREMAMWTARMYREILTAIGTTAERDGFDMVFYRDEFEPAGLDPQVIREQIQDRKVLYASPGVDITSDLLARMNASYRSQPKAKMVVIP